MDVALKWLQYQLQFFFFCGVVTFASPSFWAVVVDEYVHNIGALTDF